MFVFISGVSGIGKELFVNVIYKVSNCSDKLFVVINCGVLFENLFEFELFGYVKGVFIGVVVVYLGLFREVDGGILFLDEIGDMLMML